MKEQLILLEELQEVDIKVGKIRKESEKIPSEIKKIKDALSNELNAMEEIRESLSEHEKEKRDKDGELDFNLEKLSQLNNKLGSIKTNAEYQAVLREIAQSKKLNKENEEGILVLMEAIEEEKARLRQAETCFSEKKKDSDKIIESMLKKGEELEKEIAELEKERLIKLNAVDPKVSRLYETLKSKLKGNVLAGATGGACTGCYMHLPPQLINDAMKLDKIYQCPNCLRILMMY